MTTFVRSRRNDHVLIGFFALVLLIAAVRVAMADNMVLAVVLGLLGLALIGLGVWVHRQPSRELRLSPTEITLVAKGQITARIGHAEASGRVRIRTEIRRGHAWYDLVDADQVTGTSIPLDGFRFLPDELAAALNANGWQLAT